MIILLLVNAKIPNKGGLKTQHESKMKEDIIY